MSEQGQDLVPTVDFQAYENTPIPGTSRAYQLVQATDRAAVVDQETLRRAAELDGMLGAMLKQLEASRKSWTGPLNEYLKRINANFKVLTEPLKKRQAALRGMMITFQREEQRKAEEAAAAEAKRREDEIAAAAAAQELEAERLRKLAAEKEAAGDRVQAEALQEAADTKEAEANLAMEDVTGAPPPAPVAPSGPIRGDYGSVTSFTEKWTFKVEKIGKVPRAWLILNEKMVGAAIRGKDGIRNIPGLKIYDEGGITTR